MPSSGACRSKGVQSENKRKRKDKYVDFAIELKTLGVTVMPILIEALGMVLKMLGKKTVGTGNQKKNQEDPDHSSVKMF